MVYYGTANIERIVFHSAGEPDDVYCIELEKFADSPFFSVKMGKCLYYEFYMDNNSDYERIKMCVHEAMFDCETVAELADALKEVFKDGFEEIIVDNPDENKKYLH